MCVAGSQLAPPRAGLFHSPSRCQNARAMSRHLIAFSLALLFLPALVAVFGFVGAAQADKPIGGLHCGGTQAHPCPGQGGNNVAKTFERGPNPKYYEMIFRIGPRGGSIIGLLLLVAAVWAVVNIAQSVASTGAKALWIVFVLVLPLVGFLAWLVAGPRAR